MPQFYQDPKRYQKFLSKKYGGELDKLYDALCKDDLSEPVLAALFILRKTRTMPRVEKTHKTSDLSFPCRLAGNELFQCGDYNNALQMYNLAIGSAPEGSRSIVYAYSNRSTLFQKVGAYSAALTDIETCLTLQCPPPIETKLKLRREECLRMVSEENIKKDSYKSELGKEFFNFSVERHPHIPCASASVDVVIDNQIRKVVAAKDIPAGSVVAIETAFASNLNSNNYYFACHYCHKFVFNLIPCDTCCETFFCSNDCKEICLNEYHNIECQIIDLIKEVFPGERFRIPLKAALKMKSMAKTWEELIAATANSFNETDKSISEQYDANNIQSILNITHNVDHFVYGQRFNQSFIIAIMIHSLEKIPGFFPMSADLKKRAIRTFSRIIMHVMDLHPRLIMIENSALCYPTMDVNYEPERNSGLFSFTDNLKHACEANLLVLGLFNKVALVATQNITKGTELTISYVGHWFDHDYGNKRAKQMIYFNPGCQCRVCVGKWNQDSVKDGNNRASLSQKSFFMDWFMLRVVPGSDIDSLKRVVSKTWKGLDLWKDKPNTKQYIELYAELLKTLCTWQYLATENSYVHT